MNAIERVSAVRLAAVGLISSVSGALLSVWLLSGETSQDPAAVVLRTEARNRTTRGDSDPRVPELDARVRRMERELAAAQDKTNFGAQEERQLNDNRIEDQSMRPTSLDAEAEREIERGLWEQRLESFDAEPVDPGWAAQMEASIADQYSSMLGTDHDAGTFRTVECRKTMCKAIVDWQDTKAMHRGSRRILHGITDIAKRCVRHVIRSDADPSAVLVIDCTS